MTGRTWMAGMVLAAALGAPPARAMELDLGVTLGATAPLTEVLRRAEPGLAFAGEIVYGPLPYLEFGARYVLGWFPQEERDAAGNVKEPVLDHGIGALARFNLVGGERTGWLADEGWMSDSFWIDFGLAYHRIGNEGCFGFDAGFGYELRVRRSFYLSPLVRFENVFGTSQGTAAYVVIGLAAGFDFGELIGGDESDGEGEDAAGPRSSAVPPRTTYGDYPPDLTPGGGTGGP